MKLLIASFTLCAFATLSSALPVNASTPRHVGLCEYVRQHAPSAGAAFIPQCDAHGNFIPHQCSAEYCWCVDIFTGQEVPNSRLTVGTLDFRCDRDFYCPFGWSQHGSRCFIFIDSPKSWSEAEGYCLFEGANLASIHSEEESHFIQILTRGLSFDFPETWIGGHNAVHHFFWMWSDGSKFSHENWCMDNKKERTEHCLKMNYGHEWKWNFASCNETLPFVCAKKIRL